MARSPRKLRRVYWDSCAWIAQIWDERCALPDGTIENRGALCRAAIDGAEKGGTEILTSALTLVEVSKVPPTGNFTTADKIKDFFENDYIVIVRLDRELGEAGRELMQRGFPGLKPADATHLASAAMTNAEEMHTFDVRLLSFDGKIVRADGTNLKICKPSMGGAPVPLLEGGATTDDDFAEEEPSEEQASAAVRASGEGAGVPGGRGGIRDGVEADSAGGTGSEASAEEAEQELTGDQIEALDDDETAAELNKLEPQQGNQANTASRDAAH
jgi:predicted nucleic acid-binding protein